MDGFCVKAPEFQDTARAAVQSIETLVEPVEPRVVQATADPTPKQPFVVAADLVVHWSTPLEQGYQCDVLR